MKLKRHRSTRDSARARTHVDTRCRKRPSRRALGRDLYGDPASALSARRAPRALPDLTRAVCLARRALLARASIARGDAPRGDVACPNAAPRRNTTLVKGTAFASARGAELRRVECSLRPSATIGTFLRRAADTSSHHHTPDPHSDSRPPRSVGQRLSAGRPAEPHRDPYVASVGGLSAAALPSRCAVCL